MKKSNVHKNTLIFVLNLALIITFCFPSISLSAKTARDHHRKLESEEKKIENEDEDKELKLSLDDAIAKGLENSLVLEKVENQVELAKLTKDNSDSTRRDLYNSTDELYSAAYRLDSKKIEVYNAMATLDSTEISMDQDPGNVAIHDTLTIGSITLPAGTKLSEIRSKLDALVSAKQLDQTSANQIYSSVVNGVYDTLKGKRSELDAGLQQLEFAQRDFQNAKSKYDASVNFAMMNVASKLGTTTITSLDPKPLADLLDKMSSVSNEVTAYSYNIYKNQIALLIQKSYYEALKQQKLLEVKEKSRERAAVQYQMAEAAYEVGAKSKDDMLLAKSYYQGTDIAYQLQEKEYENAMIELKKNLNIPLDARLILEEREPGPDEEYDLKKGIESGTEKRLEVKKAKAQLSIYKQLKTAVDHSGYVHSDNEYKEVELLIEKAEIELKNTQLDIESEIRQSYATLQATREALKSSWNIEENAKENLEIAIVKYEAGYGVDNALLEKLNLESMSGTMVEIIAAQENLASIQEKVIEITNGYNLARAKYLNDVGILPY